MDKVVGLGTRTSSGEGDGKDELDFEEHAREHDTDDPRTGCRSDSQLNAATATEPAAGRTQQAAARAHNNYRPRA